MTTQHGWHESIDRYTSNDTLGQLLIATVSGSFGVYTLTWSVASFMTSGLLLPLTVLLVGLSLSAIGFAIMGFRNLYLSVVGDEESMGTNTQVNMMPSTEEEHNDPLAVAKHQYAAGRISEKEFEQRVENILDADEKLHSELGTMNRCTREDNQETN